MTDRTFTLEAYQWFHEHAGWNYRPTIESPEEGRVRCALELARAEYALNESSAYVEWVEDDSPDTSWMNSADLEAYRLGRLILMGAILHRPCECCGTDQVLDSLWGISMYVDDQSYRRDVEANLALEAGLCHPLDRRIVA